MVFFYCGTTKQNDIQFSLTSGWDTKIRKFNVDECCIELMRSHARAQADTFALRCS